MALIKCPECGKEISDFAETCPNCGFPIKSSNISYSNMPNDNYTNTNTQQDYTHSIVVKPYEPEIKKSKLGILALVLSILGCTFWIGIILAIIDLRKNDGTKKLYSIIALCVSAFWLIMAVSVGRDDNDEVKSNIQEQTPQEIEVLTEIEEDTDLYDEIESEENKSIDGQSFAENTEDGYLIQNPTYEDVFFYDLMDDIDSYNGKYIRTVIQVSSCYGSENERYIKSQHSDYDLVKNSGAIDVYPDNYSDYEYGEYITVEGRLAKDGSKNVLPNAHIVNFGEEAKRVFDEGKNAYEENVRKLEEEYEKNFKENATSPSYDDLMRYPDSYKEIQIKINAKIVRVEPDGIIFSGDIEATMSGETIALYDGRKTKEPKLREGDSVTIWGYGKGTTTVKLQDVSGWIPKTVDKYDIPAIDMRYIEIN